MSRAEDCLDAAHLHVGVCQRAGYANGRADVIEELSHRKANDEVRLTEFERDSLWMCVCGHDSSGEHNGLGCYGRISYEPLVTCTCRRTDADYEASVEFAVETIIAGRLANGGTP